ncbi:DUF4142 domain-containing protein [Hymenobacter sp. 15J16-1T3B]|uniref:DUF4142 domain-containing protein n=1 Tax=Hymenobacter sp. 15J16-1T3B TaxID=2886941 RepID=UPI001D0FF5FD|nr:DUF4142 domain-containing protein [Hymenobacter sp. 15J16-1T3B]MCC3158857.1 DUF4142 domain-containing protein [Hymenobacter sp. 15J16-1T3B]
MKRTAPFLLILPLLVSACSSSSSTTGTAGASTAGSSITSTSSSNDATSGAAATPPIVGGSGGVIIGSGTNTGTDVSSGRSAADVASDVNLFAGTFATMDDPTFMLTAASSNMLEVQMGQLAAQKASSAEVRKYGQMMVDHHTKATQDWQSVASALSVTKPAALMPVHQAMLDRVAAKSGKDFDEAYMDAMETAHKLDVAMFEVKSKGAQNAAVQSFASRTLPMLRSHGTMANSLEKKVD